MQNRIERSSIYYFFPFRTEKDFSGDTVAFDENLVFKKTPIYTRKLMRSDVKDCITKMDHYMLDKDSNPTLAINTYCFLRDENGHKLNQVVLTNISNTIMLSGISIYRFDKENQFLVLRCYFNEENLESSENMERIVRASAHFVNNYFKITSTGNWRSEGKDSPMMEPATIIHQEKPLDVLDGKTTHDSYVTVQINDKEYTFCEGANSFTSVAGFIFDFDNYQAQYLSRFFLYENDPAKRYSYGERLAAGSTRNYILHPEEESFETQSYTSMFSSFGSSIIAFKPDTLELAKDQEEIEALNRANRGIFYSELLYDFLIAINYRIRIKKQILKIGKINYDYNSKRQYLKIRKEIQTYSRESALYYFENVSQFDSVNQWYKKLMEGLNIVDLCDELEAKLKDANSYIGYITQELKEAKEKKANRTAYIFSAIVGTVLASFEFIQVVYGIVEIPHKLVISILGSLFLALAASIGCFIILRMHDKSEE